MKGGPECRLQTSSPAFETGKGISTLGLTHSLPLKIQKMEHRAVLVKNCHGEVSCFLSKPCWVSSHQQITKVSSIFRSYFAVKYQVKHKVFVLDYNLNVHRVSPDSSWSSRSKNCDWENCWSWPSEINMHLMACLYCMCKEGPSGS